MKGTGLEGIRVWAVALAIASGCGGSLGGTGSGGRGGNGGGGDSGGSPANAGGNGGGGGDFGGSPANAGGSGGGGGGGDTGGDGGSGGVPCAGSSTPCTAGQVCVHQTCGGPAAVCTPLPDGGQCASGWTRVDQCASGIGPGCEPPPCEPPPPHCADVPVACAGTPSCGCLTIGVCQGNGACLIVSGSQVTCGTE